MRRPRPSPRRRVLLCAGLALGIVALARPQWGRMDEQVFDQSREIIIAMDLSRSMTSPDVKPSRLERSKLLVQSLLDGLRGERVGLIVFSGTAFLQSPVSSDYEILREFLPALGPDYLPEGGTNYRQLIETAADAFGSGSAADRYLIILSDGEATDDDWKGQVASALAKKGVRVIGLGVGTAARRHDPRRGRRLHEGRQRGGRPLPTGKRHASRSGAGDPRHLPRRERVGRPAGSALLHGRCGAKGPLHRAEHRPLRGALPMGACPGARLPRRQLPP